jgi:hypothetical protein
MKPRKSGVLWLEVPSHVRSRPVNERSVDACEQPVSGHFSVQRIRPPILRRPKSPIPVSETMMFLIGSTLEPIPVGWPVPRR